MSVRTITHLDSRITGRGAELLDAARGLVVPIRAQARQAELERAVTPEIVDLAQEAGLLATMVPKSFGGDGLGFDVLCETARILATGDASAAWTVAFLIEHNWMACHLHMDAQRELFADRNAVRIAGALAPTGRGEKVDGGYLVSGHWRYNSGTANADWIIIGAMVREGEESVPFAFLIPKSELVVNDDWFMSGMSATSSVSVQSEGVLVPDRFAIEIELFHSRDGHPGAVHPEPVYRYPMLFGLTHMMCAFAVGTAEGALAEARERMETSRPWGLARIDRESSRVRWAMAHQQVRSARLLYENSLEWMIAKCDAFEDWSLEEQGQLTLDQVSVAHAAKDAIRSLLDGVGSSPYSLDDPLQRRLRDIHVIANHLGQDFDVVAERGSRWLMGLGRNATDPFPPRRTARSTPA